MNKICLTAPDRGGRAAGKAQAGSAAAACSQGLSERVLVIGDDMRIFLAVVRSLGRAGKEVHVAPFNWRSPALASRFIAKVHRLPRYGDDPAGWLAALQGLLDGYAFDLVIPCCDRAIVPLDAHRDELAAWRVAIPDAGIMDLLFDKEETRRLCAELGVPVAAGARLARGDSAAALAARYGLPLVVKPRRSYARERLDTWGRVWIVDSEAELAALLPQIDEPAAYLVEACFDGDGVGVSVLADNGEVLHAFQHRRLRQGRGGCSSYRVSEPVAADLFQACEKVCRATGLTGVCMFEFRHSPRDGSWILIETNARFWGSMALPLALGVDFPLFLHDLLVHGRRHAPVRYAAGIRSRNLVLDGYNLIAGLRDIRADGAAAWAADLGDFMLQPARWLTGRERSDSFVADDLGPALSECAGLAGDLARKLVGRRGPGRRTGEREAAAAADPGEALG